MSTRSFTAIAPPRIENGAIPNCDWSIAMVPSTETSSAVTSVRAVASTSRVVPCSVTTARTGCGPVAGHGAGHRDPGKGVLSGFQHAFQHVAARALDVGGGRLRVESRRGAQGGLVDDERVERHVEVGAARVRRDVPCHVVAGDDVVVAELRERPAAPHFDDHEREVRVDAKHGRSLREQPLVVRVGRVGRSRSCGLRRRRDRRRATRQQRGEHCDQAQPEGSVSHPCAVER